MSPLFFICLQLIARHRTRTLLLQQTLKILIALQNTKWKKVKKYKNKLGARKRRQPPSRPRWQPKRNQVDVIQVDIYARTGIFEDVFEWIYQKTKALIQQPRYTALYKGIRPITTALSPHARLLLILHWLRHYPRLTLLRDVYHVSTTYISREIKHILPILYTTVQSIQWPKKWVATGAFGAHGSVDCTAHYRWRVHPRQAEYYRGDKHAHFIAAQVVVDRFRRIVDVHLGLGHNNDQGMLRLTGLDQYIADNELIFLGDGGYHHYRIITPSSIPHHMQGAQKDERSDVEVMIGCSKTFQFASGVVRHSPEIQQEGLIVVYNLTDIKLSGGVPE